MQCTFAWVLTALARKVVTWGSCELPVKCDLLHAECDVEELVEKLVEKKVQQAMNKRLSRHETAYATLQWLILRVGRAATYLCH